MVLAKNIRYLRKKAGLSQEDLATKLGYKSFTTIQKWESGIAEPSILILKKLSEIFDSDISLMASEDLERRDMKQEFNYSNSIVIPKKYYLLDDEDRVKVDGYIDALLSSDKYKKDMKEDAI